jgi:SAM-dependent methyltransferase
LNGTEKSLQSEQRARIAEKYSDGNEYGFWDRFADRSFTDLEELAVREHLDRGCRVLNVGCGCGREAVELARRGMEVCALDVVPGYAGAARERLQALGLPARVACADATEGVPFSGQFDAAVLFEQVYQHIPERRCRLACLNNLRVALKPGGLLLLSAFNEGDIDLWARLLWMRETQWQIAALAAGGDRPLDARYLDPPAEERSARRIGWKEIAWLLAYLRFLIGRKRQTRKRLHCAQTDETSCCKRLRRSNPLSSSSGWFWFRIMGFPELSHELEQSGFAVQTVYPLLGCQHRCSPRASQGAPLLLIVAQALHE